MNAQLILIAALSFSCGTSFLNKTDATADTSDPITETDPDGTSPANDTSVPPDSAEPDEPITANHPRLFFSMSDVPRLQAQIYDFERAEVVTTWDRYVSERRDSASIPLGEGVPPPIDDDDWAALVAPLPSLALFALFTDDEEVLANSLEWIQRVVSLPEWADSELGSAYALQGITIAYDLLHDKMDPTLRVQTRARIIDQAVQLSAALTEDDPWAVYHSHVVYSALLMAGVVTEHDYDTSTVWLGQARRFFNRTLDEMNRLTDGSWPEGPSVASRTLTHTFQALSILDRHYGLDLEDSLWLEARGNAMLRLTKPGFDGVIAIGDGTATWLHGPEHQSCFVDSFSSDRKATWLRQQHLLVETGTSRNHELWLEFLWCDPSWMPAPPTAAASPVHHFEEWGVATWHSGFSPTDSAFAFKASPPVSESIWASVTDGETTADAVGTANLHPDAGSIAWYPSGQSVLTMGRTTLPKRTALSNTYTFQADQSVDPGWSPDDISEWWSPSSFPYQVGLATNVGQRGEWKFDFGPPEELTDTTASILLAANNGDVTVMVGDFGGAYPSEFDTLEGWQDLGLERLTRTIVILPEEVILVFDHVQQTTNLVHNAHFTSTTAGFSVSGSSGFIYTPDGQGWAIDALTGGSLLTDQLIQRIDQPAGPWVHRLTVSNSLSAGEHNSLYALRSSTQSISLSSWSSSETGIEAQIAAYSEGMSETYTVRVATESAEADRLAFLGFSGFVSVTPSLGTEIRF